MHSSLVLGYSLWGNRKRITSTANVHFVVDVFIVFAVEVIATAIYCQAMRVHVNGRQLLQMVSHWSLANVRFVINKRLKLKPKLLTV